MNTTSSNKCASEEVAYSSQSYSDLLAEAMEKQYVPAELIYAWDMHLKEFTHITKELKNFVNEATQATGNDYKELNLKLQELEIALTNVTTDSNEIIRLRNLIGEFRVELDAVATALALLGNSNTEGGILNQLNIIIDAVSKATYIVAIQDSILALQSSNSSLISRMDLLESRHASDMQELINYSNTAVNSLDLKYTDQFISTVELIATESTNRGAAIESLKQSIANSLTGLSEGSTQLDGQVAALSTAVNLRIDNVVENIPPKALTVSEALGWETTSIESLVTFNKPITLDRLNNYSNLLITPKLRITKIGMSLMDTMALTVSCQGYVLGTYSATQKIVSIEDGVITVDLELQLNTTIQVATASLGELTDDEISISFSLESTGDSEINITSSNITVCAFN